ncbi:hypothetical protein OQA88_1260 [Cercophora sp. LCS_1]
MPPLASRLLGSAFPIPPKLSSTPAIQSAKAKFQSQLDTLLRTGQSEFITFGPPFNADKVTFSIQVFSATEDEPLCEYHHLGEEHKGEFEGEGVNGDTVYRIASVTKLLVVYTMLVKLKGTGWLDERITKYVPELLEGGGQAKGVGETRWGEVTLRSLAGGLSGISRDFALQDLSAMKGLGEAWPVLKEGEVLNVRGMLNPDDPEAKQLTLEDSLNLIRARHPMSAPFRAPFYSNTAFQLLAMAYEKIAGQTIDDGFAEAIAKPLGLVNSSFSLPADKTNSAVSEPLWSFDMSPYGACGSAYSTSSSLSRIGRSILASELLPPSTTRAWLKPLSHTGSHTCSVGMPWEIIRLDLPLFSPSHPPSLDSSNDPNDTPADPSDGAPQNVPVRPVDIYAKNGSLGPYCSALAISPDHGIGFTVLTRGYGIIPLIEIVVDVWIAAAEQAAREEAAQKLAGRYQAEGTGSDGAKGETYVELSVKHDRTGLVVDELVVDGQDVLNQAWRGVIPFQSVELWPTGDVIEDGERIFQALEQYGLPETSATGKQMLGNVSNAVWAMIEDWSYGGYGLNEFIIKTDADGRGLSVRSPAFRTGEMKKSSRQLQTREIS